jgi:putative membrane protein
MRNQNTCWVPRINRFRIYLRVFLNLLVTAVTLLLLLTYFPRLGSLKDFYRTIWLILVLTGLQMVMWPLLIQSILSLFHKISVAFMLIVFPLLSLIIPAVLLMIADWLSPGLEINGFASAFFIAFVMVIISMITSAIFASDDELAIFRWALKKTAIPSISEDLDKPGIIFLEIDGLAGEALRDAIAMGKVPNMKRWLDCGSHKLVIWESDLSSQTSAAQAGILHGNNFGIPAFRWYDKNKNGLIISSSIKDISELERQISDGRGLLSQGGAVRGGLLSGDASRVLMTASRVLDVTSSDLRTYFLNPSNLLKTCSTMVLDWYLEKKAAWCQALRHEKPRVNRGGVYFILRSIITVFLRDLNLFALKGDMYSGLQFVYVTFAGYDEVSHHSGIKRSDTLEVLRKLDREFRKLEKIARDTPRKYHLVVLSDHGQTQGATFKDRYGERLEDVIRRIFHASREEYRITGYETRHESAYYIDAALRDFKFSNSLAGKRLRSALIHNQQIKVGNSEQDDVIVLNSGNLGLVYFPAIERRVTFEELTQEFPRLLLELVAHPGIGFVMVRSKVKGTVALGKRGKIYLSTESVEGENPLIEYGPWILPNLVRADSFPNIPDILVMSTYWKDTDEVAAFEELVSSHGGAGGNQSRPFILYPMQFDLGTQQILGAEAVYKILKRWTTEVRRS